MVCIIGKFTIGSEMMKSRNGFSKIGLVGGMGPRQKVISRVMITPLRGRVSSPSYPLGGGFKLVFLFNTW